MPKVLELAGPMPHGAAQAMVDEATMIPPLGGIIDFNTERARLQEERRRASDEAAKVTAKLCIADFVAREVQRGG